MHSKRASLLLFTATMRLIRIYRNGDSSGMQAAMNHIILAVKVFVGITNYA